MEIETLMMDLKKRFCVESEAWRPDISLLELAELAGQSNSPGE